MEGERKRKRAPTGKREEAHRPDDRKERVEAAAAASVAEVEVPTEEEVEEFFTILRRMRVALKYFDQKSGSNSRGGPTTEVVVAEAAEEEDADSGKEAVDIGLLDLNAAAPEAAESGYGLL